MSSPAGTELSTSSSISSQCVTVVICGEAGSGKSSLVNMIAGTNRAVTSSDAGGCTAGTNTYDISMKTLNVKLVDTAGLDEGPRGTVPDKDARRILKKLLRSLTERGDIHLIMYCVRGERAIRTLRRNYDLIRSQVKRKVPIVLVVTCLESHKPEMEGWWRVNERSISNFGMTFDGHACITTMTGHMFVERYTQSYDSVCKLIERCCMLNKPGIHAESSQGTIAPRTKPDTIVVFGETGAGKSSLINLMVGKEVADTFCGIEACTTHWKEYHIEFGGESFKVFDTVGLDEPHLGNTQFFFDAVENAYSLIQNLERTGGVDLLVLCMPAGRLKAMHQRNYHLFRSFLCDKKVPMVLAITNLEREQDMESWWIRNQKTFHKKNINVDGHACITTMGHRSTLQAQSRDAIWKVIKNVTADGQKRARRGNDLFISSTPHAGNGNPRMRKIVSCLTKRCHMPPEVARQLVDRIGRIKKDVVEGAT